MEETATEKTRDEIESLKWNWFRDPVWDLEDTEGFEEHMDELVAFSQWAKAKWQEGKPEPYRVAELPTAAKMEEWLNECYREGYRLVSLSPYGRDWDHSAAFLVMKHKTCD